MTACSYMYRKGKNSNYNLPLFLGKSASVPAGSVIFKQERRMLILQVVSTVVIKKRAYEVSEHAYFYI